MYRYNIRNIFLKGINRKMSRLFNRANSRAGGADRARCLLSSSSSASQEDLYLWCVATASLGQRSSIFKQAGSPAALIQWQTTHLCMHNYTCASGRVHEDETHISNSSSAFAFLTMRQTSTKLPSDQTHVAVLVLARALPLLPF